MRKIYGFLALLLSLCLLSIVANAQLIRPMLPSFYDGIVTRRALIIACDLYKTKPNTFGACSNNANAVQKAYAEFDFKHMQLCYNQINSESLFIEKVKNCFFESDTDDINYVYISCHGVFEDTNGGALVLSDGNSELYLTETIINKAFKGLNGTHFLVIDACNSGAIIGRGISGGWPSNKLYGGRYKVLCSSGGSEKSWYWNQSESGIKLMGAGYFSSALTYALNKNENYPSDTNRDGAISFRELYEFLCQNHAPSFPQAYPYNDDFEVFKYQKTKDSKIHAIGNVEFYNTVLSQGKTALSFSFTIRSETVPIYQIVYYKDNKWDFDQARFIYDPETIAADSSINKLPPGKYKRSLALVNEFNPGYALIYILEKNDERLSFICGRLISILPSEGLENLKVLSDTAFQPLYGQEMPIIINHNIPCLISASVYDMQDNLISALCYKRQSRPQGMSPQASSMVWNGRIQNGNYAKPGMYKVRVICEVLGEKKQIESESFELLNLNIPNIIDKHR